MKRNPVFLIYFCITSLLIYANCSYARPSGDLPPIANIDKRIIHLIIGIIVVFPAIGYFITLRKKGKKQKVEKTDGKAGSIEDDEHEHLSTQEANEGSNLHLFSSPTSIVSDSIAHKILHRLAEFENKRLFIRKDLSLSFLALYCDTNVKYLSAIINTYKKKDYYNYINELRINYIVEKLKEHQSHRRLKMAALANEVGFSSPSKFASNFKKIMGVSPSEFIKSLPPSEKSV